MTIISKLTIIYLLGIILLTAALSFNSLQYQESRTPTPEQIQIKVLKLKKELNDKTLPALLALYVSGAGHASQKITESHKILGLQHLFSPSGLHLSAVLLLFGPLLKMIHKRKRHWSVIMQVGLLLCCWMLPDLWALKRVALFRIFYLLNQYFLAKREFSIFQIFFFTFLILFIGGDFYYHPLSFSLSFLFLGIILSLNKESRWRNLVFYLTGGQIIIALFFNQQIYPLGIILGNIITIFFSLFFPVFVILFSGAEYFPPAVIEYPTQIFKQGILYSAQIAKLGPLIHPSLALIIFYLVCTLRIGPVMKMGCLALSLLCYSAPL